MKKITLVQALTISAYSISANFLMFLMVWVFTSDLLNDYVIGIIDDNSFMLVIIILLGFIVSTLVSIGMCSLVAERTPEPYIWYSSLIAFLGNIILWMVIARIDIYFNYHDIIEELNFWEKLIVTPRILAIFSIYSLDSVINLWFLGLVSYSIIFALMLYLLETPFSSPKKRRRRSRRNKKNKSNSLWE